LLSPEKVNVLTRASLLAEVRDSLSSMYMIMEVVSATVIFVIALMSGMLSNIYFTQRIPEFGVLAALGISRARLMMKIVWETVILTVISWSVGSVLSVFLLKYLAANVFKQRGLFLDAMDPWAYQHTLPIPVAITIFAMITVWVRLKRLDAVSVIERR
jgi:ABC-type antimicrobial peptide transport system permease subunit